MIRTVIADDQALFRAGLRSLLSGEPDIDVVAEAEDGLQAFDAVRRHQPDVVLMDIRMPHTDGLSATRAIRDAGHPARVVVLTTFALDEYVFAAIRAGASGFVVKDAAADEVAGAIRAVARGDELFAPFAVRALVEAFARTSEPDPDLRARLAELTARELEVLRLVARGRSNVEIAEELVVGTATVKSHVHALLRKLGARDRVQAVVLAYEGGVVGPGEAGARGWHSG